MSEHPKTLRVLIVDDHAIVRAGLRTILEDEPGLEIVGEAANAGESLTKPESTEGHGWTA